MLIAFHKALYREDQRSPSDQLPGNNVPPDERVMVDSSSNAFELDFTVSFSRWD
jgi:hypothetical protein